MQKITPFLWFDNNAEEAASFYTSLFKNSSIGATVRYGDSGPGPKGSVMTIAFKLNGQDFAAINGGPVFKFTPAVSLFTYCKTEQEINTLFEKLSAGGEIMMPLAKYPFSEKYAFFKDKYGLAWQLILSNNKEHIAPCLLFVGKNLGKAKAAVEFYVKVFKHAKIDHMQLYEKEDNGNKIGTVMHSSFFIEGQEFISMDGAGPHKFSFNESLSFVVNCDTQEEIDYFWKELTKGGAEAECGWLKDQFGVSWQITPTILPKLMQGNKDAEKANRVMKAILQMKKIDIAKLQQASEEQ